jgi:hypothetical protein
VTSGQKGARERYALERMSLHTTRGLIASLMLAGCTGEHAIGDTPDAALLAPVESTVAVTLAPIPGAQRSVSRGFRDGDAGTVTVDSTLYDPIAADATFHVTLAGMDLSAKVSGCEPFLKGYPLRLHIGSSCADATSLGPGWDSQDAGAEALVYCNGTSGTGASYSSRLDTDARPWTLGGPASTNILGRVLVIHDPVSDAPLACGVIPMSAMRPPDAGGAIALPLALSADLAGYCTLSGLTPDASPPCPDRQALVDCATDHCGLAECFGPCADYVGCLNASPDPCHATSCTMNAACGACTNGMFGCLANFCLDTVGCAPVTPGGPCSTLETCCAMQGDYEQACLRTIHQLEKLGGDPTCLGTTQDWDFNSHVPVPCNYDR